MEYILTISVTFFALNIQMTYYSALAANGIFKNISRIYWTAILSVHFLQVAYVSIVFFDYIALILIRPGRFL